MGVVFVGSSAPVVEWLEFSTCSYRLNRNIAAPIFLSLISLDLICLPLSLSLSLGRRTLLRQNDQHRHSCRSQISAGQNVSDNIRTHRMQRFPGFCLKCGTKHPRMYGKSIKTMKQRQGRSIRSESQRGESKIRKLRRLKRRTRSRSMKRLDASVHVSRLSAVTVFLCSVFDFGLLTKKYVNFYDLNINFRFFYRLTPSLQTVSLPPDLLPPRLKEGRNLLGRKVRILRHRQVINHV